MRGIGRYGEAIVSGALILAIICIASGVLVH